MLKNSYYFELAKGLARSEGERLMSKADEPAYTRHANHPGLTKREAYAAEALKGLLAQWTDTDIRTENQIVEQAWRFADMMIAESEKSHD